MHVGNSTSKVISTCLYLRMFRYTINLNNQLSIYYFTDPDFYPLNTCWANELNETSKPLSALQCV